MINNNNNNTKLNNVKLGKNDLFWYAKDAYLMRIQTGSKEATQKAINYYNEYKARGGKKIDESLERLINNNN